MQHLAALSLAAVLASCSGRGAVPFDAFESEYAAIFCEKLYACCSGSVLESIEAQNSFNGKAACRTSLPPRYPTTLNAAIVYDEVAAGACLDALEAQECSEAFIPSGRDPTPAACIAVFSGTLADNEDCRYDVECAGGTCFRGDQSNWCGRLPELGEECGGSCAAGLACVDTTCEEQRENGAPCLSSDECLSFYCDGAGRCADDPSGPLCPG